MRDIQDNVVELMEKYRVQCLWFLRPDYVPTTPAEMLSVLDLIERYGDRESYMRAEELKSWLSPDSKVMSSGF